MCTNHYIIIIIIIVTSLLDRDGTQSTIAPYLAIS